MSDFNSPTPPAPAPQRNNDVFKYVAVGLLAAVVALLVALVASGSGSGSSEKSAPATTTPVPVETTPAPVENKYDLYYEHVLNNSGQANSMSKSDVIEFGDLVCQTLDEGYSIERVVRVLAEASTSTSDQELSASVMYGAITYLCSEYKSALAAYLGN